MEITTQSIHTKVSDREKAYFEKKLEKLERFYDQIHRADVFCKEKSSSGPEKKEVEVKLLVPGNTIVATESGSTFQEAIDLLVEKLKVQLKKYKGKHG